MYITTGGALDGEPRYHYGRRPDPAPARTGDVRHSVLDVRRAAAVLGWRPEVGLDEGLRRTIDWYQVVGHAGTG